MNKMNKSVLLIDQFVYYVQYRVLSNKSRNATSSRRTSRYVDFPIGRSGPHQMPKALDFTFQVSISDFLFRHITITINTTIAASTYISNQITN